MRTWGEIHEKISELMDKLPTINDSKEYENICNQIDALLWVLKDSSGKPI